jgi:hypothetical protein
MTLPHPAGDPYQEPFGTVRHYYGDAVRMIFVAVAILIGLTVPLSGDIAVAVLSGAPVIVGLLVLAGLTHPHGKIILFLNVLASGAGVILSQIIALAAYAQENLVLFVLFEFISVLLMAALYFSVKNVRALLTRKIGHIDGVDEFSE